MFGVAGLLLDAIAGAVLVGMGVLARRPRLARPQSPGAETAPAYCRGPRDYQSERAISWLTRGNSEITERDRNEKVDVSVGSRNSYG